MLKIRDDVDLKELEKFDYNDLGVCYKKYENYALAGIQIVINKTTRLITRLHPYSLREEPTEVEIQDLVDAGLVEKV
jgi:hypothetical protein